MLCCTHGPRRGLKNLTWLREKKKVAFAFASLEAVPRFKNLRAWATATQPYSWLLYGIIVHFLCSGLGRRT